MANCDRSKTQILEKQINKLPQQKVLLSNNFNQNELYYDQNKADMKFDDDQDDYVAVQLDQQLNNFRYKRNRLSHQYLCKDLSLTEFCLSLD